jgi:CheY-like chemotaxis protein
MYMSPDNATSSRSDKILVAEDNPINQNITCAALRELGFEPEIAINGDEAVIRGKTGDYALILMDVHMPVLDGIESARRIRAIEAEHGGRTPIVAMTALSQGNVREKALEAGMDGYLEKPFEIHQLKYILREHLHADTGSGAKAQKDYYFAEIFDRQHLLERCMGDAALAQHLVNAFLRDAPRYLEQIRYSVSDNDWDSCTYLLHKLRGAAGTICAGELFHSTDDLARACTESDCESALSALAELEERLQRFSEHVNAPPASPQAQTQPQEPDRTPNAPDHTPNAPDHTPNTPASD